MNKIIFGITGLTLGGAERVLVDIANALVDKYDITIFTLYSKGELEKELDKKIHLVSLYDFKYTELSKFKRKMIPLKVLFSRRKIFKKYIEKENYQAQIAFLEGPITRIFSTKSDAKKIAWIHNDISKVFGKSIKATIKRILDRNRYEKYDTLAFVSVDNLDKFNKVYDDMDLPHETVIHNYINAERILEQSKKDEEAKKTFNPKELNFVQVSRLVEQKAIDRLIDVHVKLMKQGYKHHIYIVGDGPLREKLIKQIKENKVENTFTLLGAKKNPYQFMKNADAVCLFSKFEGYPMVLEEAKILRKYILTTNTSSREVLMDYAGNSIITTNDEQGIENAIKSITKNKMQKNEKNNQYVYENNKIIDKIVKTIEETKKKEEVKVMWRQE